VPGRERVYLAGDTGSFPGRTGNQSRHTWQTCRLSLRRKIWCVNSTAGQPLEGFRVELACIIDSLGSGTLVTRSSAITMLFPTMRLLHWLKRLFEWWYLRQYH